MQIRHDAERQRFEVSIDGATAYCQYQRDGNVMRIHHTEVPPAHQGRGIAAAVVKAVLDHARSNNMKVIPACSYVRSYMQKHPNTLDLLA